MRIIDLYKKVFLDDIKNLLNILRTKINFNSISGLKNSDKYFEEMEIYFDFLKNNTEKIYNQMEKFIEYAQEKNYKNFIVFGKFYKENEIEYYYPCFLLYNNNKKQDCIIIENGKAKKIRNFSIKNKNKIILNSNEEYFIEIEGSFDDEKIGVYYSLLFL